VIIELGVCQDQSREINELPGGRGFGEGQHALFVGFVFSMIFGHAPIIVPAVVGVPIHYRPAFYAHLGLLHVSLIVRMAGDLTFWLPARQWGGMLNALAIVLFFANTAYGTRVPTPGADRPPVPQRQ
jgi:hypothetical protein